MQSPGVDSQGGNAVALDRHVVLVSAQGTQSRAWPLFRKYTPVGLGIGIVGVLIVMALAAPWIAPYEPAAQYTDAVLHGPTQRYFLGTDMFGRDLLSRLIWGTRISLQVGLGAAMVGFAIGVPLGLLAGYVEGTTEAVIMRLTDLLLAFPLLLLALIIVTALGGR
jgi:peptide/nickel transport system permease protein